jgi:fumarylacetoacetase
MPLDHTHSPTARSWLAAANTGDTDFPIQNLPFASFRRAGSGEAFRGGVAIGDQVVDLGRLARWGLFDGLAGEACKACAEPALNAFLAMGKPAWRALRHELFAVLGEGVHPQAREAVLSSLVPQAQAEYRVPVDVGNYTDFYTSEHHARNVGQLRRPDAPLSPNFHWMPIAYHGRASSIVVSGTPVQRPLGQRMPAGATQPAFGPCERLDYELELAVYVGTGNAQGEPIPVADADRHVFGIGLLNDWSARDIQFWENQPLGPFLAKNFATTVSPWIVTLDALAPFRTRWPRNDQLPAPLPYLDEASVREQGALDIRVQALLQTAAMRAAGDAPHPLSSTSFRHQSWTVAQMLAHHTVGGCNLQPGDVIGTGTISGPQPQEAGALIELSRDGREPLALPRGEQRTFLQDGDTVVFRAFAHKAGAVRIGFGACSGTVVPARQGDFAPRSGGIG